MARKVFISFLGKSNYRDCTYQWDGGESRTRFIQLATLQMLHAEQWSKDDAVYILVTEGAKTENWEDKGDVSGLKTQLDGMGLNVNVESVTIPDGNNETELKEIFSIIYGKLELNDELYFDITHGFRYLPMFTIVLGNYAKFLKNVTVKSITYGNFESPADKKPILDLTYFSTLQDWTTASADFLHSGNATQLKCLSETSDDNTKRFADSLYKFANDMTTCRGLDIFKGDTISRLQSNIEESANVDSETLVSNLFERIQYELKKFNADESINTKLIVDDKDKKTETDNGFLTIYPNNGVQAARWCFEHQLYQQTITILQEAIVSMIIVKYPELGISIDNGNKKREVINAAFARALKKKKQTEDNDDIEDLINRILSYPELTYKSSHKSKGSGKPNYLVSMFKLLTNLRNDINHSGMRLSSLPSVSESNEDNPSIQSKLNIIIESIDRFLINWDFNLDHS